MAEDHEQIYVDFKEAVNKAPAELEKFLDTEGGDEVMTFAFRPVA